MCTTVADVAIIVDTSGSIKAYYDDQMVVVKSLAEGFGLSPQGSHVGVIQFSYFAATKFYLNAHTNLASFNKVTLFLFSSHQPRNFDSFACPIFLNEIRSLNIFSVIHV